jgi:HEAT repeat protein
MKKRLLALSIGLLSATALPVLSQEDNDNYRQGYQLILQQQWQQASDHFADFQQQFANSAWADDAAFWNCYALEQLSSDQQAQFECYQQFMSNWPQSSWTSDARAKLLLLASSLADRGNPEFLSQLEFLALGDPELDFDFDFDFDDQDISETVARALDRAELAMERVREFREDIHVPEIPPLPPGIFIAADGEIEIDLDEAMDPDSLRESVENARRIAESVRESFEDRARFRSRSSVDDELLTVLAALRYDQRAADLLIQRLDNSDDPQLRSRIVLLLEDIPGTAITDRLLELANSDPSEEVRNNAVIVLLDRNDNAAREQLLAIARDEEAPVSIRAEIVDEMDRWDPEQTLPVLQALLETTEPALLEEVADTLADIGSSESIDLLLAAYQSQSDPGLQYLLLEEIADAESPAVLSFLSDLALQAEDDELASIAIEGIAEREDNIGVAALEHIYLNTDKQRRRMAALSGIGEAESAQSLTVISQLIAAETNPAILAAAARALGDSEQEGAIAELMRLYDSSEDDGIERAVIRSLRQLDEYPAATEALLGILEDRLSATDNR